MYTIDDKVRLLKIYAEKLGHTGRAIEEFNSQLQLDGRESKFNRITFWSWKNCGDVLVNGMTFADMIDDADMKIAEDADILLKDKSFKGDIKAVCFFLKHRHPEYQQKINIDLGEKKISDEAIEKLNILFNEHQKDVDIE
jgi:hypothetical protein